MRTITTARALAIAAQQAPVDGDKPKELALQAFIATGGAVLSYFHYQLLLDHLDVCEQTATPQGRRELALLRRFIIAAPITPPTISRTQH